jgi:sigma-B regulation protein RsbU (phosphoserine phosphatase)
MYTDGITEATDHDTRMFGIERTLASLASVADLAEPASYTSQLLADVADFVGQSPQSDDITLLALNWGRGDDETTPATLEATIGSRLEEVFGLIAHCDALLAERGIPAPLREDIQLVLEELLVNIVEHGQASGHLTLQLRLAARTIVIELHNDGEAFDPLQSRPPELTGDIADRQQLGGLGIHLVRSMVSHMSHTHDTHGNHLLLRFNRFGPLDTDGASP